MTWIEHLSGGGGVLAFQVYVNVLAARCVHFELFCIDSVGFVSYVYKVLVNAHFLHEFW